MASLKRLATAILDLGLLIELCYLQIGFSVVFWILRFKHVKFFMGLACFQTFLMLVERDIMGLMFIGFLFFNFRFGFLFLFIYIFILRIE